MRKLTHDKQVAAIAKVNPNVEVLEEIKGNAVKVLCRCKICGYEWMIRPYSLKEGKGCPACAGNKKLSHEEHAEAIAKVNPNIKVIGKIKNASAKVLCRCSVCGHKWLPTPHDLKRGYGCPACAKIKIGNANRLPHTKHIADIKKVNPNIEILEEIKDVNKKVLCKCKICHHEWKAAPEKLKRGRGCPVCGKIRRVDKRRLPHNKQVEAINNANPNVEILEKIISDKTKVLCCCTVCHHEWRTRPDDLKHGYGCPLCAKRGFRGHEIGKLYIMVDDLNVPTTMKIGVSINEDKRSKEVLQSARRAGAPIPALHVAKTWEGPTELMMRIEQMMHENYEEWNIKFPTKFDGCTEFFQYTPETAEAFDIIEETLNEIINGNKAA